MARAEIHSGICGFTTLVETSMNDEACNVVIQSNCEAIQKLGQALTSVEPFQEISFRGEGPATLRLGAVHCTHTACPVPVGILKAVEVEAGLALPADVTIHISRT